MSRAIALIGVLSFAMLATGAYQPTPAAGLVDTEATRVQAASLPATDPLPANVPQEQETVASASHKAFSSKIKSPLMPWATPEARELWDVCSDESSFVAPPALLPLQTRQHLPYGEHGPPVTAESDVVVVPSPAPFAESFLPVASCSLPLSYHTAASPGSPAHQHAGSENIATTHHIVGSAVPATSPS